MGFDFAHENILLENQYVGHAESGQEPIDDAGISIQRVFSLRLIPSAPKA